MENYREMLICSIFNERKCNKNYMVQWSNESKFLDHLHLLPLKTLEKELQTLLW